MRDDKGLDDKIISVSARDPAYHNIDRLDQLPEHTLLQIRRFFQDYKALEHKDVVVDEILGRDDALQTLRDALSLYRKLRRREI